MRTVLVGNGPSAPQHAARIDQCDRVIRLGVFPPGIAGNRWDVWASSFTVIKCTEAARIGMVPWPADGPQPIDVSGIPAGEIWVLADRPERRIAHTEGKKIGVYGKGCRKPLKHILRVEPSEGLVALAIALAEKPEELAIVGFDATTKREPGWGYPEGVDVAWAPGHDFVHEKLMLTEWLDSGKFLGRFWPATKTRIWWTL